jgi:hypothetical protein
MGQLVNRQSGKKIPMRCIRWPVLASPVQELLDHKHITTTQIYDKRRRGIRDSASHKVPI